MTPAAAQTAKLGGCDSKPSGGRPPTEITRSTAFREPIVWRYGRPIRVAGGLLEIAVETWTYNLGPSSFMRRLRFEDGELVNIETLGYGYHPR